MSTLRKLFLFVPLAYLLAFPVSAQVNTGPVTSPNQYFDLTDLMAVINPKKAAAHPIPVATKGKLMLIAVPAVGANPALGAFYGLAATGAMFLGSPDNTSISSLSASVLLTTKGQFIASLRGTIMTPGNGWEILTDIRYSDFSESTYGLGSDNLHPVQESWIVGGSETAGLPGAQPMAFQQIRVHVVPMKELIDHLYAGIGIHYDFHEAIKDLSLDLTAANPVITSHYGYSILNGINPSNYTTAGASLNVVYDSRDHVVSPYRGTFIQLSHRFNSKFQGSAADSQWLYAEVRHFVTISKTIPRHVLGFWGIGQFVTSGRVPYLDLPASGYDMRNRIGRGYVSGRFRGPSWVTLESEYRFPITKNGLFGGVLFANVTSTSRDALVYAPGNINEPKLGLFESAKPAAGFGARIMLNRTGRLNIAMDMAFGQNGSKGFYFAVGETF
jgi:hypothetical protein